MVFENDCLNALDDITKKKIHHILSTNDHAQKKWQQLKKEVLSCSVPFSVHQAIYTLCYKDSTVCPTWLPDQHSTPYLKTLMRHFGYENVADFQHYSNTHRETFWAKVIEDLSLNYHKNTTKTADLADNPKKPKWLVDATFNIAENCFNAPKDKAAIIYQDADGSIQSWSYDKLDQFSQSIALSLKKLGIQKGDCIGISMLMNAESVGIYLGIIKLGAIVVSIADSFASEEIKTRIDITQAKLVFTQDYIMRNNKPYPMYQKVLDAGAKTIISLESNSPLKKRETDFSLSEFMTLSEGIQGHHSYSLTANDAINILFSSGTTGTPKAIVWDQSTALKAASDGKIYLDINQNDILSWPTNLGWMMGPWLVFAALINKATIALFYDAPTSKTFIEFTANAKVNKLGVIPSIVNHWKSQALLEKMSLEHIDLFASTGEASNIDDMLYLSAFSGYKPIIEYCGGTEIGGAYITSTLLQPNIPSHFSSVCFGINMVILNDNGEINAEMSTEGEIALIPPSLGLSQVLLNKDHDKVYFKGMPYTQNGQLRRHGDQIKRLSNGYYRSFGRADDTMNLGGIKTSSAEIERVLNRLDEVLETAAIAVTGETGGTNSLIIYAVLNKENAINADRLKQKAQKVLKLNLNPLFKIEDLILIDKLPRTASNKITRRTLKALYKTASA
ncbi:AMP-binding protein [Fangia hongkongensis]|uniref:AMP-binding protein n=1 Tax=Fangia hongkongensis TaxID=270495 RepID=UPI00035E2A9F|nr:AMP-binding protein [Fangia hongkongensis]MBK2125478.1 AMP-binding protein [Fangia hongkongensis]